MVSLVRFGRFEVVAFFAGFGVLVVEIAGARLMAPYLGNTLFTWTSSIAIILASLSLGYYVGGKVADMSPDVRILAVFLFASALFVGLLPALSGPVLQESLYFGFEYGPLFAALALFALPNFLLGMVAPCVVRFRAKSLKRVGESAGNLYALSTVGSILGALLCGFYLIPELGLRESFYITSVVLAVAGVIAYGRRSIPLVAVVLLLVLVPVIQPPNLGGRLVYATDTPYYHLEVINYSNNLILLTDLSYQSIYRAAPGANTISEFAESAYQDYQPLLYGRSGGIRSALYLGLGGGDMIRDLYRNTSASIDVVEIDPVVIGVAERYFGINFTGRVRVYNQDARFFLRNSTGAYNAIVVDTYGGSVSMPYQLTSVEAVEEMEQHLTSNGSVFINIVSPVDGNASCAFRSIYRTYGAVFSNLYVFPLIPQDPDRVQNIVLIASDASYSKGYLAGELNGTLLPDQMAWIESGNYSNNFDSASCPVLTDDRNPFDVYSARVLAADT